MGVTLTAMKASVFEVDARVRVLQTNGRLDAAEACYDTALLVLNTLLVADADTVHGWARAARLITDIRQRLPIDALAPSRIGELQVRTAALLDLPDITSVSSFAQVQDVIAAAINIGAPRYNDGDIRGCAVVYWSTMQSLVAAPAVRGFSGHARSMAQLRAALDQPPPPYPLEAAGTDDFAWMLRRAFDATVRLAS